MISTDHENNLVKESKDADLTSLSRNSDNLLREQKDVLLGMYCECCTQARHYENKRATVSNIIMLATVGLIGYIHHLDHEDWPLTAAIALVGVFGAVFTKFYFDRISCYEAAAVRFKNALRALLFKPQAPGKDSENTLDCILDQVDVSPAKGARFRMYWPLFIALFGLGFTIYASCFLDPSDKSAKLTISWTDGAAVTVSPPK